LSGAGSFRLGPYPHFFIHDPEHRLISTAPLSDRLVHHAFCTITFLKGVYKEKLHNLVVKLHINVVVFSPVLS
jgi:hypothetical protein